MVWAWMLWSAYDLGTRTGLWFGHGCSGNRAYSKMNGIMVWAWMLWSPYHPGTRTGLWFGHRCSGNRTHSKRNGVMVWAYMLWSPYHLRTHPDYGLGMDALVIVALIQR